MNRLLRKNIFIFAVDTLVSTAASLAAILIIRFYDSAMPNFMSYVYNWVIVAFIASGIAVALSKSYRILFQYASFKSIANLFKCALIKSALLTIPLLFGVHLVMQESWHLIVIDFAITAIAIISIKLIVLLYDDDIKGLHKDGDEEKSIKCLNVAIFGTSSKSIAAITRYHDSPNYNIRNVITRDKEMKGKIIMGYPVSLCPENLETFHLKDVEAVLFPKYEEWKQESDKLVKYLDEKGICVMTLPSAESTNYPGFELAEIKHILESQFIPDRMSSVERATKRLIDLCVSMILIAVFLIPMAIIYLILLITEGKPVIFKQERIGRFGRPFNIFKFRTMKLDAEADGPALYSGDDDPRLTKVGKFLRLHHLDELPQLFNVFKGEMSFVGYRPERKVFIDQIVEKDPRYAYLYQIRPGVTSYATLKNGYTDNMEKMLRRLKFDLYYLNHRSILFDLKILWNTFLSIAVGKKF